MKWISGIIFLILSLTQIFGQDHFVVAIEMFEPSEQEIITMMKGSKVETFLAKDTKNKDHYSKDYTGRNMLLWFWSSNDEMSVEYATLMKNLSKSSEKGIQIFGFAHDKREELIEIEEELALEFPNFPNSEKLGDVAYAGELGLNRMLFVDDTGIIREILPRSFFKERTPLQSKEVLDAILTQLKI